MLDTHLDSCTCECELQTQEVKLHTKDKSNKTSLINCFPVKYKIHLICRFYKHNQLFILMLNIFYIIRSIYAKYKVSLYLPVLSLSQKLSTRTMSRRATPTILDMMEVSLLRSEQSRQIIPQDNLWQFIYQPKLMWVMGRSVLTSLRYFFSLS